MAAWVRSRHLQYAAVEHLSVNSSTQAACSQRAEILRGMPQTALRNSRRKASPDRKLARFCITNSQMEPIIQHRQHFGSRYRLAPTRPSPASCHRGLGFRHPQQRNPLNGTPAPGLSFVCDDEGAEMPTYYFDLWNGQRLEPDECGVELSGLEAAFEMTVRTAREMLSDATIRGEDRSAWVFKVRDERGLPLLNFSLSAAAVDPHYTRALAKRRGGMPHRRG